MIKLAQTNTLHLIALTILALLCSSCQKANPKSLGSSIDIEQEVLAKGFKIPWSIEVISEEDFLFTERMGTLYRYQNGEVQEVSGLPESRTYKTDREYGGMMDVSLHPQFEANQMVYLA